MLIVNSKKTAGAIALIVILAASFPTLTLGLQNSNDITFTGIIVNYPENTIIINPNNIIGVNQLHLGCQLDWDRWKTFVDRPIQKQLAQEAGFSLIRIFDFRKTSQYGIPNLMPCTNWNEQTKTGTWDWTYVDMLTQNIFSIDAEPLFCLGWAYNSGQVDDFIPSGMAINTNTGLPYPESYAAYAKEWVKHFKQTGLPVRFYQIMNEPYFYFGWNGADNTKLSNYVELWNAAALSMRQENPNIFLSNDAITQRKVLDYWLIHGEPVDFVDFHKYDSDTIGQYTDAEMLNRAENAYFETSSSVYGVDDAKQKMFNTWGKNVLAINSESNFNSAWSTGTDPKIQQMIGAVWLSLVLKTGMLKGLNYNVYFEFTSSKSYSSANGDGWGFGMINKDDNQPWYPYYVHKLLGSHLSVGDNIIQTQTSSTEIACVAWKHESSLNIFLISKVNQPRTITLQGINGEATIYWIDNETPAETPSIQNRGVSNINSFTTNGYTVALLEMPFNP